MAKYRDAFFSDDDIWYINPALDNERNINTHFVVSEHTNTTEVIEYNTRFFELPALDVLIDKDRDANASDVISIDFVPGDTRFGEQLHLLNTTPGQVDVNIIDAWDDYTGDGVAVTVIDAGFDFSHNDLVPTYNTQRDYDFSDNDFDASPVTSNDNHGTAVMGLIGAAANGTGAVGTAFDAELIGFRVEFIAGVDLQITNALVATADTTSAQYQATDVVNMSFGISAAFIDSTVLQGSNDAIDLGAAVGRDGLGVNYVASAGNSRTASDTNGSIQGADIHTITVAALDEAGDVTFFSTPGASTTVSAFGLNIFTTDRTGADGYDGSDFTASFGGTSAAAPIVSGIVALMLEANADLGWRDVQTILSYSARHVGSEVGTDASSFELTSTSGNNSWLFNDASDWNGGGLHFSNDYGFGLIDATAAVRMAETWQGSLTTDNQATAFADVLDSSTIIATGAGTSFTGTADAVVQIEHVEVEINFTATGLQNSSDLLLYITAPSGTESLIFSGVGSGSIFNDGWQFTSNAFRGEDSSGVWTVRAVDNSTGANIEIDDIGITFYGSAPDDNDLFIFTNEYSDYAGTFGHGSGFAGGTGADTINAAAVTSASTIDLLGGTGTIDGVNITLASIETVFTGDGNDTVIGDGADNLINTGRGDDTINASEGDDTIIGGQGDDTVVFNGNEGDFTITVNADDSITFTDTVGNGGTDVVFSAETAIFDDGSVDLMALLGVFNLTDNVDDYFGTAADERINALDGNDIIRAGSGDDVINGGAGDDFINGGVGTDTAIFEGSILDHDMSFDGVHITVTDVTGTGGTDTLRNVELLTFNEGTFDPIFGTDQADTLSGSAVDDLILAGDSGDTVNAGDGNDFIFGNTGDDQISGNAGADYINGGDGIDEASYAGSNEGVVVNLDTGIHMFGEAEGDTLVNIENLQGSNFDDELTGDAGANTLNGGSGNDTLDGGEGNDRLLGGAGDDTLLGGEGNDRLDASAGNDTLNGGAGNDRLNGNAGDDTVTGGEGNDIVNGGDGNDVLRGDGASGGEGSVLLGAVENLTTGGSSVPRISFTVDVAGTVTIDVLSSNLDLDGDGTTSGLDPYIYLFNADPSGNGGVGTLVAFNDDSSGFSDGSVSSLDSFLSLNLAAGDYVLAIGDYFLSEQEARDQANIDDTVFGDGIFQITFTGDVSVDSGEGGNDVLSGGAGDDLIYGGAGDDLIRGGNDADTLHGDDGIDRLFGEDGADALNGGEGNDRLSGGEGADTLRGGDDNDRLFGEGGNDLLGGDGGDDVLFGGDGNDSLFGASGSDYLNGQAGEDALFGGNGDDVIYGGADSDVLAGGAGDDRLFGNSGADELSGGVGEDVMTGGGGADSFAYTLGSGLDAVTDFVGGLDTILVDADFGLAGFGDLQIVQRGANTLIRLEPGGVDALLLFNTDATSLTANDFVFEEAATTSAVIDDISLIEDDLSETSSHVKAPEFHPDISDFEIEDDMIDSFYDADFAYA